MRKTFLMTLIHFKKYSILILFTYYFGTFCFQNTTLLFFFLILFLFVHETQLCLRLVFVLVKSSKTVDKPNIITYNNLGMQNAANSNFE